MSRVRNASEFLEKLTEARDRYEFHYRAWVNRVRVKYEKNEIANDSFVDELTETHIRQYFIDFFLNTLNWHLTIDSFDQFPNLIPEAQIESLKSGNVCFLDYLGVEKNGKPLLILEAKRPNIALPKRIRPLGNENIYSSSEEPLNSIICGGLKKEDLSGNWNKSLEQLRKYVESTFDKYEIVPKRVVLTNGDWLIIFLDPADSFLESGTQQVKNVVVYEKRDDIQKHYKEVFDYLEHQKVLNETPPLNIEELFFHISPEDIFQILHGIKLRYFQFPGFYEKSPRINIKPILFIRSKYDKWLIIESRESCELPIESKVFNRHIQTINKIAIEMVDKITKYLPNKIVPTTIEKYFEDKEFFNSLKAIQHTRVDTIPPYDDYQIVTGQHTHYFRLQPSVVGCPHHIWAKSKRHSCATHTAIESRSVAPRSFFTNGEKQHCNHVGVEYSKSSEITFENKDRCGFTINDVKEPFCKIWHFETRLCCRTCIFENVCTKSIAFNLPCSKTSSNT